MAFNRVPVLLDETRAAEFALCELLTTSNLVSGPWRNACHHITFMIKTRHLTLCAANSEKCSNYINQRKENRIFPSLEATAADARVCYWRFSHFRLLDWNLWVYTPPLSEMSCFKEEVNFLPPAQMVSKSYMKWWQKKHLHELTACSGGKRAQFILHFSKVTINECMQANIMIYGTKDKYLLWGFLFLLLWHEVC